jgi:hypothetical protein
MNAVEIEEAISKLAEAPFEAATFPYSFLEAFGNKATTLKRLKSGTTNQSDLSGVLQRNNIHIKVCSEGEVTATLAALRESPATARQKAKFILVTDGASFEAENLVDGETVACAYADFHDHFGFFLPLAGITTVKQIRENAFDIKATGRLNRLYIELLRENPEWDTADRREELNHFFARLIFCFFAEDTGIFMGSGLFTDTVRQMSAPDSSNTHEVVSELFRAMNTKPDQRESTNLRNWAKSFPYVNGGLFSDSVDVPRFTKIARSYLLHLGSLDWTKINPDIFGSMIQAVADDEERGALGMHYTSVPNILKVLNPLFLDDLRAKLEEAGDNIRKLLNLRNRIARIRVFDPACGSGNFLVIAYKHMREIEAEINRRRREADRRSDIPLTNIRGIEIRNFSVEIARLALIIAEYQCDVLYRGEKLALAEFLPLEAANWITCGNALRLDWLAICPPTGAGVKVRADDLFSTPLDQAEMDFENEGGETFICGNPPYKGAREQTADQKKDLAGLLDGRATGWKLLDYVAGWFVKAAAYGSQTLAATAFVSTNSICQGQSVPILWPLIFATGHKIAFAHTSFAWSNLASHNAGVTVVVVGLSRTPPTSRIIYVAANDGTTTAKQSTNINAYLISGPDFFVEKRSVQLSGLSSMNYGNYPGDGNHLTITAHERQELISRQPTLATLIRPLYGAQEFLRGLTRYCLWIDDEMLGTAMRVPDVAKRIENVRSTRIASRDKSLHRLVDRPHQYRDRNVARNHMVLAPTITSERREYIPADLKSSVAVTTNQAFAIYDGPLHDLALISSRMHLVWITTVCGKLKTDIRYSSALGWNTFPVPTLTDQNKADLTRCAEEVLLAREAHFPATIADLYDPDAMPNDLRAAHDRNDETLERIYIGRRFKNDTERLEKLFEMYTQMTAKQPALKKSAKGQVKGADS